MSERNRIAEIVAEFNEDRELIGERVALENLARALARTEAHERSAGAAPISPPLPGRSCRHGIVPDQCEFCDGRYEWLIVTARAAYEQGYPIHVATRTTCAEHIAEGDDQKAEFAFGQAEPSAGAAPLDVDVLAQALGHVYDHLGRDLLSPEEAAPLVVAEYAHLLDAASPGEDE